MDKRITITALAAVLLATAFGCDNVAPPLLGSISGTVTYTGDWPPAGQDVYVIVASEWPLQSMPILFGPIPEPAGPNFDYSATELELRTYAAVALYAYPDFTFMGAYGYDEPDDVNPDPVILTENQPNATGIDFDASYEPPDKGSISGTVTFTGQWPADSVYVMAFEKWPPEKMPTFYAGPFNEADSWDYTVTEVVYGTYNTVGVYTWRGGVDYTMLGAYGYDPPGDTEPDPVTVDDANPNPTGIDISAQNPPVGK
jgi:hypothetical protein